MAKKRMFNLDVLDTDAFLDMPLSAQALYFWLSMRADDDGFIGNPKRIKDYIGASDDDLKLLLAKRFIIAFEDGVIVIKHWRMHNTIQKDRYHSTNYIEDMNMLRLKDNGSYTLDEDGYLIDASPKPQKEYSVAKQMRIQAKKDSSLPTCFDNMMRNAFEGRECPVCGVEMHHQYSQTRPTIQHNIPISMGGKHEIDNISIICQSCNCSLQNKETEPYNTDLVRNVWECIGNVSRDIDIDLDIDKELDKDIDSDNNRAKSKRFVPPTIDEVKDYCFERGNNVDAEAFIDFYESKGWMVGKNKMKDWKAAIRTWEKGRNSQPKRGSNSGGYDWDNL